MRFSKPSPLELENGRLLGSAQMPRSLARAALATNNTVAKIAVPKTDVKEQLLLSAFEKGGRRGICSLCDIRKSPLPPFVKGGLCKEFAQGALFILRQ